MTRAEKPGRLLRFAELLAGGAGAPGGGSAAQSLRPDGRTDGRGTAGLALGIVSPGSSAAVAAVVPRPVSGVYPALGCGPGVNTRAPVAPAVPEAWAWAACWTARCTGTVGPSAAASRSQVQVTSGQLKLESVKWKIPEVKHPCAWTAAVLKGVLGS